MKIGLFISSLYRKRKLSKNKQNCFSSIFGLSKKVCFSVYQKNKLSKNLQIKF